MNINNVGQSNMVSNQNSSATAQSAAQSPTFNPFQNTGHSHQCPHHNPAGDSGLDQMIGGLAQGIAKMISDALGNAFTKIGELFSGNATNGAESANLTAPAGGSLGNLFTNLFNPGQSAGSQQTGAEQSGGGMASLLNAGLPIFGAVFGGPAGGILGSLGGSSLGRAAGSLFSGGKDALGSIGSKISKFF